MLERLRTLRASFRGSLAAVTGIASVLVAVGSVERQIDAHAREAQVNRSFALYDQFIRSDAIDTLISLSAEIDVRLARAQVGSAPGADQKTLMAQAIAQVVQSRPEFYQDIIQLLRQASTIARCTGDEAAPLDLPWLADRPVCDPETVTMLLGGPIAELFFRYRPVMYCDTYLKLFEQDIGRLESIVGGYMQTIGFGVYETAEQVPGDGLEDRYVVLEFGPQEHCAAFAGETHSVALEPTRRSG